MAITQFSVVPSRATGQDTFSADAEVFWGQLPTFVTEVNSFIVSLNGSWTSSSTTSLLVGTGSKTLTVGTGLGFQVGMPVRLANTDIIYMTGDVTSYNSLTGELICNITSSTGSGTYAVWSVYAIPASVGATLVANKFTGLQTFADEVAVASASTINLTTSDSNNVEITGTTTIAAVTMPEGAVIKARASGAFQLTNSSSLIVQGGANYTTTVNDILTFTKDGAGNVHVEVSQVNNRATNKIYDLDATVAGNNLTITVNAGAWDFRSTTLTDGTPVTRILSTPVSLVIPDGATLGSVNAISSRYVVGLLDDAGTLEPFAINIAGGNQLDETNLITTTTISTGADSNNVAYSTTGRTSKAYRIIGFIDITEATAGTYATAPTLVQGCGGQALASLSSLGYGQTWQAVTRVSGTTYYNTTGRSIQLAYAPNNPATGNLLTLNGNAILAGGVYGGINIVVPPGGVYTPSNSGGWVSTWELR